MWGLGPQGLMTGRWAGMSLGHRGREKGDLCWATLSGSRPGHGRDQQSVWWEGQGKEQPTYWGFRMGEQSSVGWWEDQMGTWLLAEVTSGWLGPLGMVTKALKGQMDMHGWGS